MVPLVGVGFLRMESDSDAVRRREVEDLLGFGLDALDGGTLEGRTWVDANLELGSLWSSVACNVV